VKECSKSVARRLRDSNFCRLYFRGDGVDIGGKPDPLSLYTELFPGITSVKVWDLEDGDAQFMAGVQDSTFDFVHSSHCLEHLRDAEEGLKNWLRILKPGGYIVAMVPDEDLYEQGVFPSTFNTDHKATFTIYKKKSWSAQSKNLLDLFRSLGPEARIEKIELLTGTYRFDLPRYDQTLTPVGECGIEFIIRKADPKEALSGGRTRSAEQPHEDIRIHYNQYRDDMKRLKSGNDAAPPFQNKSEI
jgi:SAM-dependent methyltransferase